MGREIRRVRAYWEHPKEYGKYKPLLDDFESARGTFIKEMTAWSNKFLRNPKRYWKEYIPYQPDPEDYMPKGQWYQLYENVSEGTPISPPFSTKAKLRDWLINNNDFWGYKWTESSIDGILEYNSAPSGIMSGGKFYQAHEQGEIS